MAANLLPLRIDTLRELIAAGSACSASLLGQHGGYAVLVQVGRQRHFLATQAGVTRLYPRLDTAANDLRSLGIGQFAVNVENLEPGPVRPSRSGRALAMPARTDAAEYTAFLQERTQAALDDRRPAVSSVKANAAMDAHKAKLSAKLATALSSRR